MFKVIFFLPIFVLLIITKVISAEEKKCPEKLFDTTTCVQSRNVLPSEEFQALLNQCLYAALGLRSADGGFIEPRTENEKVLIGHAKALEECMNLIEKMEDDEDESSEENDDYKSLKKADDDESLIDYFACVEKADAYLLADYDCSADL